MQRLVHDHAANRPKIFCDPLRSDLVDSDISSAILSFPLLAGFRAADQATAAPQIAHLTISPPVQLRWVRRGWRVCNFRATL